MTLSYSDPAPTLDDIWRLFRETSQQMKETDRIIQENARAAEQRSKELDHKFQETERILQENARAAEQRSKELDHKFQETERILQENARAAEQRSKELDRKFQETDRKIQEVATEIKEGERRLRDTERVLRQQIGELGNRLGEFVQSMIKPAVVRLFKERGIEVHKVNQNVEVSNPDLNLAMEIDLLVVNKEYCVLIEVKSNLSTDDVNEHLERMTKFKPLFPEYANKKALGAVAGISIAENVAKYAYRKGFFVIGQRGDAAVILNNDKFRPVTW